MIGVKYNNKTKKWEAKIGIKKLGEFETKEKAMEKYDEHAKKTFAFPILNNKNEVEEDKDIN